ncbi:MAG: glycosyltransferase [Labilithrix sp.]|nr:glycosyltransferase [Labilithrix sp.]
MSVCFPCYNEEETIADVLTEAHELLAPSGLDYEILVCNDCSTDRTAEIIAGLVPRIPGLRVLTHEVNRGIFVTFEDLYAAARKDFVFLNSTDRQWDTRLLFRMLPLTRDHDVIVTNRTNKPYGPVRALVSWGFNLLPRVLFGTTTYDAGSVKLTRREIITRFPLVSTTPFSEAERLVRAERAGYRITGIAVEVAPRRHGVTRGVNPRLMLRSLHDVARVWKALRDEARS